MPMDLSKETATEYFANLNPIATKISMDINETKSSYEHIWNQLSTNEQIDIINDTLIKPEIALRYFDNFSTSSSSSASLSNDDFVNDECKSKFCDKIKAKSIYNYDGKNISSYTAQKTGLKVIHDDIIGVFRDEHSTPFSYKTKSQMNLKLFNEDESSSSNHHRTSDGNTLNVIQQKLLKFNIGGQSEGRKMKSTKISEKSDQKLKEELSSKCKRFYTEESGAGAPAYTIMDDDHRSGNDEGKSNNFLSKFICKNNLIFNAGTNLIMKASDVGQNNCEGDEGLNLIKNVSSYSGLTSSSSVPSEEEEDIKQACEDSKLLLENDELRKGFDFLNNW